MKTKYIAEQTGVKPRTIQNIVRKYKEGGGTDVPTHKTSPGRPRKLTNRTLKIIRRQVDLNPSTSMKKVKFNNPQLLGNVSTRTVQRRMSTDLGYRKVKPAKKSDINEQQMKNRKSFALERKDWDINKWRQVLWSDEAIFSFRTRPE